MSNEYPRLHPLNQEAAEQFNSVLRMVTHSVAMMSLENYLTAINVFVTFFNLRWIDCLINVWQNFIDFLFTSKPDIQMSSGMNLLSYIFLIITLNKVLCPDSYSIYHFYVNNVWMFIVSSNYNEQFTTSWSEAVSLPESWLRFGSYQFMITDFHSY